MVAVLWSGLGVAMALALPETPAEPHQETGIGLINTISLPGQRQIPGTPDSTRPLGY